MSEGVQRLAGSHLRTILSSLTKNRFYAFLTGIFTTGAIQSSSATTVMTVSLVNARLLTLKESAGVMLGANIGTTVTAWIISGIGFRIKLATLIMPIIALAIPAIFIDRGRSKYWGEALLGFGLMFLGLDLLQQAIPYSTDNQQLLTWLQTMAGYGFWSYLIFVTIGAIMTLVVQSSSAAMAFTLTATVFGWIPFDIAAAMVLGENIGTTATAEIAAIVANKEAKRSARIHTMFNLLGVLWMILALPYFLNYIAWFTTDILGLSNPFSLGEDTAIGLALFHTAFNIINGIFFLSIIHVLIRLAIWMIPVSDEEKHNTKKLTFIAGISKTPELAMGELTKELTNVADYLQRVNGFCKGLLTAFDKQKIKDGFKQIKKYEEIISNVDIEVIDYITELSALEMTAKSSDSLNKYMRVSNLYKQIALNYVQIGQQFKQKQKEQSAWLAPEQRNDLIEIFDLLHQGYVVMKHNINRTMQDDFNLELSKSLVKRIEKIKSSNQKDIMKEDELDETSIKGTLVYFNIMSLQEIVANLNHQVSEVMAN